MSLRKKYGPMVETLLNAAVDQHLDATEIKKQLHEMIDKLVDEKLENFKQYLKADLIDKIDGVDDIQ